MGRRQRVNLVWSFYLGDAFFQVVSQCAVSDLKALPCSLTRAWTSMGPGPPVREGPHVCIDRNVFSTGPDVAEHSKVIVLCIISSD